jgi:hypothetical protein
MYTLEWLNHLTYAFYLTYLFEVKSYALCTFQVHNILLLSATIFQRTFYFFKGTGSQYVAQSGGPLLPG